MKGLIPLAQRFIAGQSTRTVSARNLHEALGVGKRFATWIQDRIRQYGFVDNQEYLLVSQNGETKGKGGDRRSKDYYLTLDMAKELAMVERTDKGREARRYFIDCERRLNEKRKQETEQRELPAEQQLVPLESYRPHRILTVIDQGQVQQFPLNNRQALFDVPKLAAKVKQLEVLNIAMTQQLEDLKLCYDLSWYLSEEDGR